MIGLLLATKIEASALLDRLGATLKRSLGVQAFETYVFPCAGEPEGGVVVLSGMGKQAAERATEYLIDECGATEVINVGVCGSLTDGAEVETIYRIVAISDGDAVLAERTDEPRNCEGGVWSSLPTARLATVTEPVFEPDRRQHLAACADVVDMEGVAVVDVCRRRGVPCVLLKGVTDRADSTGKEDILANVKPVSRRLAAVVANGLGVPSPRDDGLGRKVLRFAKIEHSMFSLPLLLAGAWLGAGGDWPAWTVLGLIALAGVGARTLGMSMNRILDRRLDALNPRTADRELPSGGMSLAAACGVAAAGAALYLLACGLLGTTCLMLSPVPAVPLLAYALLKRFTPLCHFGIGLCLALAPLGAFVAAADALPDQVEVLLLALFAFCWISGSDIIYALQDIESDRKTGVRSIPASLGPLRAQLVAGAVHAVAAAALVMLWLRVGGGTMAGVAMAASVVAFGAGYVQRIPIGVRFFPIFTIAGVTGALVPLLGELR
jgi:4-hydroxybenzoate polyprenyltransferase